MSTTKTKSSRARRGAALSLAVGLLVSTAAWAIDEVRFFEEGKLGGGLRVSGNAPTVQSSIKRGGKYAMKTYLSSSWSNNYRTEVRLRAPDPKVRNEYWYGFSIYLPSDYKADKIWETVAQWHGQPDKGDDHPGPPLKLTTTDGVWAIRSTSNPNRVTTDKGKTQTQKIIGPYSTGRWTDWVFRIKWSYLSDGVLEVWKDGQKVYAKYGPNTYNDARMPFFKMGIYKGWKDFAPASVSTRTLYHDQLRFVGPGGSYSQVAPTSSSTVSAPYNVSAN
jgi:hypothetical protein